MKIRRELDVESFQVANIKGKDVIFFLTSDGLFFSIIKEIQNGVALEISRPLEVLTKDEK